MRPFLLIVFACCLRRVDYPLTSQPETPPQTFPHELNALKRGPLLRLARPPVLRATHLRPQRHQNLLDAVIPCPVLRRGDPRVHDLAAVRVDARDVDLRNELDPRGDLRVALRDGDPELVEPLVVHGLRVSFVRSCRFARRPIADQCGGSEPRRFLMRRASPETITISHTSRSSTHPMRAEDAAVPLAEEYIRGIDQAI